jgi:hypothetical protein
VPTQRGCGRLEHASGEAAPARVRDTDGAAIASREQYRQTIGDQHREYVAGPAADGGIAARRHLCASIRREAIGIDDLVAMNLLEPERLAR